MSRFNRFRKTLIATAVVAAACIAGIAAKGPSVAPSDATSQAAAGTPFRFVAWGDTKTATSVLSALSDQAAPLSPNFTIYSGDLESSGFTTSGMDAWKAAINGQLTGGTTSNGLFDITFPVRGNHDSSNTSGWQSYYDLQGVALRIGAAGYQALSTDLSYSFEYGNSFFVGLDVLGDASLLSSGQISWLDNELTVAESRGLTHAFIWFHGPIYCMAEHCSCSTRTCVASEAPPSSFINVINKHPIVTASFHGHEHIYTYTHLDSSRIAALTHPFEQFIVGDAGAGPATPDSARYDYYQPKHGFVTVDVDGGTVTVNFYAQGTANSVKTVTINKGVPPPPAGTPAAPTNLSASVVSSSQINLAWTDNASDETGFKIERCTGSGCTPVSVAQVGANVTTFNNTGLTPSTAYTYAVVATNGNGDSGPSNVVTATTQAAPPPPDTTAPTVSLTAPAAGATVSGTVTISATATDNVGVSRVDFLVDGAVIGTDTSSSYSASWNTTLTTNGSHTLTARAYDAAGNNQTSAARSVTVNNVILPPPDTTPPVVSLTAPAAGATVSGNTTVSANATDNVGVSRVDFLVDGAVVGTDNGSPYSAIWNTTLTTNGSHTLTARAYDAAGNNQTSAAVSVTVSNAAPPPPDTTAPVVSLTAPADGATVSGTTTVSANATDNVGVSRVDFLVDGALVGTDNSSPYSVAWSTTLSANGSHTLTARAYDAAGNNQTSAAVSVTVSNIAPPPPPPGTGSAVATVETGSSSKSGDTNASVIWVHPTDHSQSLVISNNTDSGSGGLRVWDLAGKELQYIGSTGHKKLDLRYNFKLAGKFANGASHSEVDLIAVSLQYKDAIGFYKVNPTTRRLEYINRVDTSNDLTPYGACLYRSAATGKDYFFALEKTGGDVQQYELSDNGDGRVGMKLVRSFDAGGDTQNCVADDELGAVYFTETSAGNIWKYGAEPAAGATRTRVDASTSQGGHISPNVQGLAIYHAGAGAGYLIAADQGSSTFFAYGRDGANEFRGEFKIALNGSVDAVSGTVGIAASNVPLGSGFPDGLLVAHDQANSGGDSHGNQKFVPWASVASALGAIIDTTWDPRNPGGSVTPPPPAVTLLSLAIQGPATVAESSSGNYLATATFSDGTTQNVTASATWSENSSFSSISGGVLTTSAVTGNQPVTVSASYTTGGVTRTASQAVTIQDSAPPALVLASLAIDGYSNVSESSTHNYTATATFSNGTTQDVTTSTAWSENSSSASITSGGALTTTGVSGNQTLTVSASYTSGGVTKTVTMPVQIVDNSVVCASCHSFRTASYSTIHSKSAHIDAGCTACHK